MPVYDYSCSVCGSTFEQRIPYSSKPSKVACPKGHLQVRRMYSAPSVLFKGSGWYVTDHKRRDEKPASPAESN
jgi:putative FmdB family regulatory protein